jgi:hypothetical protein
MLYLKTARVQRRKLWLNKIVEQSSKQKIPSRPILRNPFSSRMLLQQSEESEDEVRPVDDAEHMVSFASQLNQVRAFASNNRRT